MADRVINKNLYPISPVSSGEAVRDLSEATVSNPKTGETTPRFVQEGGTTYRLSHFDLSERPVYGNMPRVLTVFDLNDI
jgi:hypothetical protein